MVPDMFGVTMTIGVGKATQTDLGIRRLKGPLKTKLCHRVPMDSNGHPPLMPSLALSLGEVSWSDPSVGLSPPHTGTMFGTHMDD